jgi:hypothetical protein
MSDMPTATEFVPADHDLTGPHDDRPMVRILQATGDGGLEVKAHEPYDDEAPNHVFVCDQCGHSESLETDMGFHLDTAHGSRLEED